jgi:hypothetical protein
LTVRIEAPHLQNRAEARRDGESSLSSSLGLLGADRYLFLFEIDIAPLEGQDFARTTTGVQHGDDHGPQQWRRCVQQLLLFIITVQPTLPWRLRLQRDDGLGPNLERGRPDQPVTCRLSSDQRLLEDGARG